MQKFQKPLIIYLRKPLKMGTVDIDAMLEKAGDFGRYQIFLMVLFSFVNIVSAFHYFSQTFISVTPEHWCNSTGFSDVGTFNDTVFDQIRKYVGPLEDKSCTTFGPSGDQNDSVWAVVKCDSGWIYNRDNGFNSIVTEVSLRLNVEICCFLKWNMGFQNIIL